MKPSPEQEAILRELREVHQRELLERADARHEVERQVSARLSEIRRGKVRLIKQAAAAGIPKTRIGAAINTKNLNTVAQFIRESESETESESA